MPRAAMQWVWVCGAVALCGLGGCRKNAVNVMGSTSIQPFAEMLAQEFNRRQGDVRVEVQGGGSTFGIQAVANGIAQIGMCSRSLLGDEKDKYTAIIIARDGVAVVVNKDNPVSELKLSQIRDLFAGRIKNWKEIGGNDQPVRLVVREEGSGTREAFVSLVMPNERISTDALTQGSTGAAMELVRNDPGAVGFMSLGQVGKNLKPLVVEGVAATPEAILKGEYPLVRPFLFAVRGQPDPKAQRFIDFVLSADGQRMLEKEGLVRAQ